MSFPDKPIAHLLGSNGPIHAVTYSSSPGTYILAGSSDRSIRLYNPLPTTSSSTSAAAASSSISSRQQQPATTTPQGKLIQTYSAHGYEVLSLSIASTNDTFASSGGDRVVFLWDVATARPLRRLGNSPSGHASRVNCVAFAGQDDALLVSGGQDTTVRIWDGRSNSSGGRPVQVLDEARDAITCVAVRGAEVLSGSVDGRVRAYDVRMGRCVADAMGGSVTSLCLTRDGSAVLVGTLESKIRLMDRSRGTCLQGFEDGEWAAGELRMQSLLGGRERWVVAGDELSRSGEKVPEGEGRVWVWDLVSGKVVKKMAVPWGPRGYEPKTAGRRKGEKGMRNIVSCLAWRGDGWGDQFCVGGTSGVVTVFGQG